MENSTIEKLLQETIGHLDNLVPGMFVGIIFTIMLIFLLSRPPYRTVFGRFLRLFFYDESNASTRDVKEMLFEMEDRFKKLEDDFLKKTFKDKEGLISKNIDRFVDNNLDSLIKIKLKDTSILENSVVGNLNDTVKEEFKKYVSELDISTILKEKYESLKIERLTTAISQLEKTIEQERSGSGRLKTIMINLFVIFNIGIIITYITWGSHISDNAIYAISGLYLSLATFIFYIIRTSHFRTGVLLSITEDNKKHLDVLEFLNKRADKNISEQDVELMKLFLINRAEREHKANHPYEVILKGVSGSNIQFKGGKMSLGQSK